MGLAAHVCGVPRVVLSDLAPLLPILRLNAALNHTQRGTVDVKEFVW